MGYRLPALEAPASGGQVEAERTRSELRAVEWIAPFESTGVEDYKNLIGTTLAHFKITATLGEGGMGEVYLAEDTDLDRKVALKLLPEEMARDPARLERFRREAKAVAALNHPNIVTIYSIEESEGRRFLTMELVDGESLDRVIPAEGLPLAKIFDIAVPIAAALTAAHDRGIVHRDLKPANIMVNPDGQVKILDFGLAKLTRDATLPAEDAATEAVLTGEGAVMGTAPYMSPEQLQGEAVDHRTDIFSLGILLYEMTTGRRPFQGRSSIALASAILKDSPAMVTEVRTDLPRHLGRIIGHCLEKEPRRRFQSALDVRNELDSLSEEVESGAVHQSAGPDSTEAPVTSTPGSSSEATATSGPMLTATSNRTGVWIGLIAVTLLVAGVVWWTGRRSDAGPAADTAESAPVAIGLAAPTPSTHSTQTLGASPSLAVLPFTDMSPEGDQEYFADGLTVELIAQLSQTGDIHVIGRRSAFQFKGSNESLQSIGERLGVGTILEGSVRKAGDRVRITAELVNTGNDFQLWSETYDRTLEDIFTIEDEIAKSVADALEVTLLGKSTTRHDTNPEAHNLRLRARFLMEQNQAGNLEKAKALLEKALELDPDSAAVWADMGRVQGSLGTQSENPGQHDIYMLAALDSLNKALTLDPDLPEAYVRIALIEGKHRPNFAAARVANQRALELAPNNPVVMLGAAEIAELGGHLDEAIAFDQKVLRVEPLYVTAKILAFNRFLRAGRLDEAEALLREALELSPNLSGATARQGELFLAKGQPQAALEEFLREDDDASRLQGKAMAEFDLGDLDASARSLAEFIQLLGDKQPIDVAVIYAYRGEVDQAFRWLETAEEVSDPHFAQVKLSKAFESLHGDPRWPAFLDRVGLAD